MPAQPSPFRPGAFGGGSASSLTDEPNEPTQPDADAPRPLQPDRPDEFKLRNPEMRVAWLQLYSAILNGVLPDKTDDRDWGGDKIAGFCACLADEALEQYRRRR